MPARQRPGDVGGAARHVEPRRAAAALGAGADLVVVGRLARRPQVQGVGVEEGPPVRARGGGDDVVRRALDQVGVPHVTGCQEQSPRHHRRRDPRTGLAVGAVRRQLPVLAEPLVLVPAAHAAGQVGPPGHGALPLPDDGIDQLVVRGVDADVDGRRREVQRPDGVPAPDVGLADRHVVLEVRPAQRDVGEGAVPAPVEEQPRLLGVPRLVQRPAQLGQAHLDLRVAADALHTVGAERRADVVRSPPRRLDQGVRTAGPHPGDRGLQQVAGAVQLVTHLQVGVPRRLAGVPEAGVQVPVVVLRGDHPRGEPPERRLRPLVTGTSGLPGERLEQLVDLGVGELPAGPLRPGGAARGDPVEVGEPAQALHPALAVLERRVGVGPLQPGPEAVGQGHLVQAERTQRPAGGHHRSAAGGVEPPAEAGAVGVDEVRGHGCRAPLSR